MFLEIWKSFALMTWSMADLINTAWRYPSTFQSFSKVIRLKSKLENIFQFSADNEVMPTQDLEKILITNLFIEPFWSMMNTELIWIRVYFLPCEQVPVLSA